MKKICAFCKEELDCKEFYICRKTRCGYRSVCKVCSKKRENNRYQNGGRERRKGYYRRNKIAIRRKQSEYYQKNLEKVRKYYYKYQKRRLQEDINFKLSRNLRSRISQAIKNQYSDKAFSSIELLGCSIEECREHLESRFQEGMAWDNYGDWHIDHIIPCSSFDLTDEIQQKECFHYSNLQPLWAEENLRKGDKKE